MNNEVRKPVQTRSIETKNKIINSSLELFSTVGYYKTNTAQIAKNANVSTGIVYGYFKDKRDILLSVLEIYIDKVSKPILDIIKTTKLTVIAVMEMPTKTINNILLIILSTSS